MMLLLRTAMHIAAVKGDLTIIEHLREHNGKVVCKMQDSDGNTPLHKVINNINVVVVVVIVVVVVLNSYVYC